MDWWGISIGGSLLAGLGWLIRRLGRGSAAPGGTGIREMLARVRLQWIQEDDNKVLAASLKQCHRDREWERTERIRAETENRGLRLRNRQLESALESGSGSPAVPSSRHLGKRRKKRTSSSRTCGDSPTDT